MTKPLAVYYEVLDFMPSSLGLLRDHFELAVFPSPDHADPAILSYAEAVFAPKGFRLDDAALNRHPKLLAIGTPTTGELHIDVEAAKVRNITVCSLKNEKELLGSISCTAELAWGMVLCLTRRIPEAWSMFKEGRWEGRSIGARTPRMLSSLRMGVIGLGRLGALAVSYTHLRRRRCRRQHL